MTARDRVLALLRNAEGAWVPGLALADPWVGGLRFGARIHELRSLGHDIQDRPDPARHSKVWQYRLAEPEQLTLEHVGAWAGVSPPPARARHPHEGGR